MAGDEFGEDKVALAALSIEQLSIGIIKIGNRRRDLVFEPLPSVSYFDSINEGFGLVTLSFKTAPSLLKFRPLWRTYFYLRSLCT